MTNSQCMTVYPSVHLTYDQWAKFRHTRIVASIFLRYLCHNESQRHELFKGQYVLVKVTQWSQHQWHRKLWSHPINQSQESVRRFGKEILHLLTLPFEMGITKVRYCWRKITAREKLCITRQRNIASNLGSVKIEIMLFWWLKSHGAFVRCKIQALALLQNRKMKSPKQAVAIALHARHNDGCWEMWHH